MKRNAMEATARSLDALGSSCVFSALLATVLAGGLLDRGVHAQGTSPGAGSDLDCKSLGAWASLSGTHVPGPCIWNWNVSGNRPSSDSCGPRSPAACSSGTSALAGTWAAGMHIRALGHAYSNLCPSAAQCVSSITSKGNLFLLYAGPASPPCNPRVRVEWSPQWNFAMSVDPPAAAVVAGAMSGEATHTNVKVKAVAGATLNSLSTLLPVQIGPLSIPVAFAGKEGHFVKQVADSQTGDVAAEMESVDWRGAIDVQVQTEISALNWSSESALGVCHSNPDLTIYAYCTQCSGGGWLKYWER
jgi:hypothetical protein